MSTTISCISGHQWQKLHTEKVLTPKANDLIEINYYRCIDCSIGTWGNWNDEQLPSSTATVTIERPEVPWNNSLVIYPSGSIPDH